MSLLKRIANLLFAVSLIFALLVLLIHEIGAYNITLIHFGRNGGVFGYGSFVLFKSFVFSQNTIEWFKRAIWSVMAINLIAQLMAKFLPGNHKANFLASITHRFFSLTLRIVLIIFILDWLLIPIPFWIQTSYKNVAWQNLANSPLGFMLALFSLLSHIVISAFLSWKICIIYLIESLNMFRIIIRPFLPIRPLWSRKINCLVGDAEDVSCELLFLSDLHISHRPTLESGAYPVQQTLVWLDRLIERSECRSLLFMGDITDTGHTEDWNIVKDWFKKHNLETEALIGNHDVNFKILSDKGLMNSWEQIIYPINEVKQAFSETEVSKKLSELLGKDKQSTGVGNSESIATNSELYLSWPRLWRPALVPVDVLLLNSNRREPKSPMTNAMGLVGEQQLEMARKILKQRQQDELGTDRKRNLIIGLHHHVLAPPSIWAPVLVCLDYKEVMDLALEFDAEAIVHGHTHMPFVYHLHRNAKKIIVVSCGSPRFTAKGPLTKEVVNPSCYGMRFKDGKITIVLYRNRESL